MTSRIFLHDLSRRSARAALVTALAVGLIGCVSVGPQRSVSTPLPIIDVTADPFNAAGDGRSDDTDAIQRAIDAGGDGKAVYFPPGTYLISSSLMNTAGVTLLGASRETSILRMTRDEPYGISMASGLCVRALTIRGNTTPSPRAHAFNGGNTVGVVIEDCIIEDWGAVAILGADNSSRNRIRNNIIRNNAHEGVYFGKDSHENIIEGNYIHDNAKNGIDVNGSRNRILYNIVHGIGEPGDTVDTVGIMAGNPLPDPARDNLIHGNLVYDCATHGIMLWAASQYTIITDNTCYENAGYGIFLEKLGEKGLCANNVVAHNVSRDNASYGIILQAAVDNVVQANQSIGNGRDGIALDSTNGPAERNVVASNVCKGNERYGIYIGPGSKDIVLTGNRLSENGSGDLHDAGD